MTAFGDPAVWLPFAFASILGISILLYVILDGFDLGVGMLLPFADDAEKDRMIASIGPFWDANETWLVLGVGILLVAFPTAHGIILTALYIPVAVMLVGLILRGVAFEFRIKAPLERKGVWNGVFFAGSLMTALSQGLMLGLYIMGLETTPMHVAFALLTALCVAGGYTFIGATWLILKTQDALQRKAIGWARVGLFGAASGLAAVSLATPFASDRIFDKWFSMPAFIGLAPLPVASAALMVVLWMSLQRLKLNDARTGDWVPFVAAVALFVIAFTGLAYSFYPYIVPERLTIYDAASAPESLMIILIGTLVVMPVILGYTALSYIIFRGKATELRYD
ncbi:MAG: cytochrome d ubiquinol oxidase subunit II [Hyphomicrobiaceae bacterium]